MVATAHILGAIAMCAAVILHLAGKDGMAWGFFVLAFFCVVA
jgi:hypothetical protein